MSNARVIVVRHGNTFGPGDTVTRVGARTDLPLVASGISQGQALAKLAVDLGWRFVAAAASPLRRTQQTANLILALQAAPPEVATLAFLTEIDYGPDENQPEESVRARLGPALDLWEEAAVPPPGWQVDPQALAQEWRAFLQAATPGETTLVVTSNGIARFAMMGWTGAVMPKLKTGAYGIIDVTTHNGATISATCSAWNLRP